MRSLLTASACLVFALIVQIDAQSRRNIAAQCQIVPSPGRCREAEKRRLWSYSTKIGACTELYGCYGIRDRNVFMTRAGCERNCFVTDSNDPSLSSYLDCEVNPSPGLCQDSEKRTYFSYSSKTSSCMQINGCYSLSDRNIFLTRESCRRNCILNRPTGTALPAIIPGVVGTMPTATMSVTSGTEVGYQVATDCTVNPAPGVCLPSEKRNFFTFSSKSGSCVQIYGCYSVRDRNVFLSRDSCRSNCIVRDGIGSTTEWIKDSQCYINPSPGRCSTNERQTLWTFSSKTNNCQQIFGCYSVRDRNVFRTLSNCKQKCVGSAEASTEPSVDLNIKIALECRINPSPGICTEREKQRFYSYSSKTGDCDEIYGCYSVRDRNVYLTKSGCRRSCFLSEGSTQSGIMESQCYIVPSQGVCRSEERKTFYTYSTKTNTCVRIFGCYGIRDRNVYLTRKGCEQACSGDIPVQPVTPSVDFGTVEIISLPDSPNYNIAPECRISPSPGVCRQDQQRDYYTYSSKTSSCVRIYGCYNIRDRNVFLRREGCRQTCYISGPATPSGVMDSQCYLNPAPGRCRESEKRSYWSYSSKTMSCTRLYGCYSIRDRNIFLRRANCERACTPGVTPETSTMPPIPIKDVDAECRINPSPSRCLAQDRRTFFSYSMKTHRCTEIYGCYSIRDRNVFLTRNQCEKGCFKSEQTPGRDPQCSVNPSPGSCAENQRRTYYSYSSKTSTCVQIYGCYSVRDRNVFLTVSGCRQHCVDVGGMPVTYVPSIDNSAQAKTGNNFVDIRNNAAANMVDIRGGGITNMVDVRNGGGTNMVDIRNSERSNMVDVRTGTRTNMVDVRNGGRTNMVDVRNEKNNMVDVRNGGRASLVDVRNDGRTNMVDIRNSGSSNMVDVRNDGRANMVDVRNTGSANMVDVRQSGISNMVDVRNGGRTNMVDVRNSGSPNMVDVRNSGRTNMVDVRNSESSNMIDARNGGSANMVDVRNGGRTNMVDVRNSKSSNMVDVRNGGRTNKIDVRDSGRTNMVDVRNDARTNMVDVRNSESSNMIDVRNGGRANMVDVRNGGRVNMVDVRNSGSTNMIDVRNSDRSNKVDVRNPDRANMVDVRNGGRTNTVDVRNDARTNMVDVRNSESSNMVDVRNSGRANMVDVRNGGRTNMVDVRNSKSSNMVDVRNGGRANMVDVRNGGRTNTVDVRNDARTNMLDVRNSESSNMVDVRNSGRANMVDVRNSGSSKMVDVRNGGRANMVDVRKTGSSSNMMDIRRGGGLTMADIRRGQTPAMVDIRKNRQANMVDVRTGMFDVQRDGSGGNMVDVRGEQSLKNMVDVNGGQTGSSMVDIRGGKKETRFVDVRGGRTGQTGMTDIRGQISTGMEDIRGQLAGQGMIDIRGRQTGNGVVGIRGGQSDIAMVDIRGGQTGTGLVDVRGGQTGPRMTDIRREQTGLGMVDVRGGQTGPSMVDIRGGKSSPGMIDIRGGQIGTNMLDIRGEKTGLSMVDIRAGQAGTGIVDIRAGQTGTGKVDIQGGSAGLVDIRGGQTGGGMVDVLGGQTGNLMVDIRGGQTANGMVDIRGGQTGTDKIDIRGGQRGTDMVDIRGGQSGTGMVDIRGGQSGSDMVDIRGGQTGTGMVDIRSGQTVTGVVDIRGRQTGTGMVDVRGGKTGTGMVDIRGVQTGFGMDDVRGGQTGPRMVDVRGGQTNTGKVDIRGGQSGSDMVDIRGGQTGTSMVDIRAGQTDGQTGIGMVDIRGSQTGTGMVDIRDGQSRTGMVDIRLGQIDNKMVDLRGTQSVTNMVDVRGKADTNMVDVRGQTDTNMVDVRGQTGTNMVDVRGQTGIKMVDVRGQTGTNMVDVRGQTGTNMVDVRGQTGTNMVDVRGQTGTNMVDIRGQTGTNMVDVRGQTGTNMVDVRGQTDTNMVDVRGQTGTNMVDVRNKQNMVDIRTASVTTEARPKVNPLDPQSLTDLPIINVEPGIRIARECLINPTPGFCLENQRKTFWTFSTKTNSCTRIMGCFDIHDRNTWLSLDGCRRNCFKNESAVEENTGVLPLECQLNPTPGRCLPSDERTVWVYNTKLGACTQITGCYDFHDRNVWSSQARCRTKCRVNAYIVAPEIPYDVEGLRIHPECHINPSPGRCMENQQQTFWTFSSKTSACTRITGCYSIRDRNTWRSREECRNSCYVNASDISYAKPLECKLVPSPGRCLDSQKKSVYTYSEKLGVCVEITGCYDFHDRNVWRTVEACNQRCHVNASVIPDLSMYDIAQECQLNPTPGRCQESQKRSFYTFSRKAGGCVEIYGCYTINDRNVWYTRSGCRSSCLIPKGGSATLPNVANTCLRPPVQRPCVGNQHQDWYSYDINTGACEKMQGCYRFDDQNVFINRGRCEMECLNRNPAYTIGGIARECRLNPTPGVCHENERKIYWSYSQKTGTCVELTGCYTIRDRNVWLTREMCRNNCIKREIEPRSNIIPNFLASNSNGANGVLIDGIRRGRRGRIITRNMNRNAPHLNEVREITGESQPLETAVTGSGNAASTVVNQARDAVASGSGTAFNAAQNQVITATGNTDSSVSSQARDVTVTRDSQGREIIVSDVIVTKVDTLDLTLENQGAMHTPQIAPTYPPVDDSGSVAGRMPASKVVANLFMLNAVE